jgi:hypothetical protein
MSRARALWQCITLDGVVVAEGVDLGGIAALNAVGYNAESN